MNFTDKCNLAADAVENLERDGYTVASITIRNYEDTPEVQLGSDSKIPADWKFKFPGTDSPLVQTDMYGVKVWWNSARVRETAVAA